MSITATTPQGSRPRAGASADAGDDARSGENDDVRDAVKDAIDERPWLLALARTGWIAKGVVYALMGVTALSIGRHRPTTDDASPEGALGKVAAAPGGTPLLLLLVAGLVVYVAWRGVSAVLVSGTSARDWLTRAGYGGSAIFYAILAVSATRTVLAGREPEDSNAIERFSSRLLSTVGGRWLLLAVGAVIVVIGAVFVVDKAIRRSFRDDMHLERATQKERRLVLASGVIGWLGRGLVTMAVGAFVVQAAWTVDRSDARGFDRALRELASRTAGGLTVMAAGVALIAYATYCWVSLRHRELGG